VAVCAGGSAGCVAAAGGSGFGGAAGGGGAGLAGTGTDCPGASGRELGAVWVWDCVAETWDAGAEGDAVSDAAVCAASGSEVVRIPVSTTLAKQWQKENRRKPGRPKAEERRGLMGAAFIVCVSGPLHLLLGASPAG